jgi:hypothetical protein
MDGRITELLSVLPIAPPKRLLIVGPVEKSVLKQLSLKYESLKTIEDDNLHRLDGNSIDLLCCFQIPVLKSGLIEKAYRLLAPGGGVFIVTGPRRKTDGLWKGGLENRAQREVTRIGFQDTRIYGLSPSLDELRLAVPLNKNRLAAASLALYQPSLKKAKFRKLVAYLSARCGIPSVWTPFILITGRKLQSKNQENLRTFFFEIYGIEVEFALFAGTPGYLRKTTLQIMNAEGRVLGYGKVGRNSWTNQLIENEAKVLQSLKKLNLGAALVPEVKYFGDLREDSKILVQSTCKKPLSSGPLAPANSHLTFLTRLFNQSRVNTNFGQSSCLRDILTRLTELRGRVPEKRWMLLERGIKEAGRAIGQRTLPFGIAHRDFTPWNTFYHNGRLFIFDWELAREEWFPLADAFHFIIQKGVLVDKENPEKLLQKILSQSSREGAFIHELSFNLGIDREIILPLLLFYLCDISTFYINNNMSYDIERQEIRRLLFCWETILLNILSSGT